MSGVRRILVDARTCLNYAMVAPVHALMMQDSRVQFSFVASEEPARARSIYRDAPPGARMIGPLRAALNRFDAYLTSDFMWASQPRGTCRIQMFHGVGGKYGFDAPTESLQPWHRLFFVNRRRLHNCIAAGAIDADSPAIRLVGMPKVDCLVNGSMQRDALLTAMGLHPERPTVLYCPTWSPASSLNRLGLDLLKQLQELPINVIVKLHDRSQDQRPDYSGGINWIARLAAVLSPDRGLLARGSDICPYMMASDVMITDHSSAGFEYLLLDRPLVRIHVPELIELARVHRDYLQLLTDVSESVHDPGGAVGAVERALADPHRRSASRRATAEDLFFQAGTATRSCANAIYEAIDLEPIEPPVRAPAMFGSVQAHDSGAPCRR